MHEIVIVKAVPYRTGDCLVRLDSLKKSLWWTKEADSLEAAIDHNTTRDVLICDAIRFDFDFCPNPAATHFCVSALKTEHWTNGPALFAEFLPQLVEIAQRYLLPDEYLVHFYVLFDVQTDECRDEDGHLDEIQVYPTLLGELDMSKLTLALVGDVNNG